MSNNTMLWEEVVLTDHLDTGYIECVEDRTYWCPHIESLITKNQDSKLLWDGNPLKDGYCSLVQVPVVPTQAIWAAVRLEYVERLGAFRVILEKSVPEEFLGFVHHGEGRLVLRRMLIDWFFGNVPYKNLKCPQSAHSFAAEMMWQKDIKKLSTGFAQWYSIWSKGKCLGCTNVVGDGDTFDPDLVPDIDRPRSPFHA